MAATALKEPQIKWERCRGFNDSVPPSEIPDDQVYNATNVVLPQGGLCKKRLGSEAQSLSGAFSGFNQLAQFVPAQNEGAAEVHFIDRTSTGTFWKIAAGTTATSITNADGIASNAQNAVYVQANGKLYCFYDSSENRAHVYDPSTSTSAMRRVGLAAPAAPTIADQGTPGSAYPAVGRYYRIQWLTVVSGTVRVTSNLGTASTLFTPDGSHTDARVTRPSLAGESETHWVVWGSIDGDLYYKVSGQIAAATTTYDDHVAPSAYADNEAQPDEGAFTPPPSAKFAVWDGAHMLSFGVWETSAGTGMVPKSGRVYITPALETTDSDDDERISNTDEIKGWIDLNRNGGGEDRGIAGPLDGQVLVGQSKGIYLLIQTGINTRPYKRIQLSPSLGMVSHHSSFMGEDEAGRPCIYWLDPKRGPYRYGYSGVQWLGADIQVAWSAVNLDASTKVAYGVFNGEPGKRRCHWYLATGSSNEVNTSIVYHLEHGVQTANQGIRGGWVFWSFAAGVSGGSAPRCAAMLPTTIGATMSRAQSCYLGFSVALIRTEAAATTTDAGTPFAARIVSKEFRLDPLHVKKTLSKMYVQAKAQSGINIYATITPDYGRLEDIGSLMSLTASAGAEERVLRQGIETRQAQLFTFHITIGDPYDSGIWGVVTPAAAAFEIDKVHCTLETTPEEVA